MIDNNDIDTLARTLYGEARGEPYKGKLLVAYVILNRWRTGYRNKETIAQVCQDPWQFSCWNKNDPNLFKLQAVDMADKVFRECYKAALEAIDSVNELPLTTRHYYATSMPSPPFWAAGHEPVREHGRHRFFEGVA